MSPLLLIVIVLILFGGVGFVGHRSYGNAGLGGGLGGLLILLLIVWLLFGRGTFVR